MQRTMDARLGLGVVQRRSFIILLIFIAFIGIIALLFATRWGIGTTPDSVGYVTAARNLLQGRSMSGIAGAPVVQWPPFYPLSLSLVGLFGIDPLSGAHIVQALLYGANVLLAGYLLRRYSGLFWFAAVGTLLLAASSVMLRIHAHAWSEPLFILLGLLGMVLVAHYIDEGRPLHLVGAALLVGLAALTRYVGVTLIGTAVLGLLFFRRSPLRKNLIGALVFGILTVAPLVLWMGRALFATGSAAGREIAFHPIGRDHFWHAMYTFSSWLHIADLTPGIVWVGVWFALIAGAVAILWLRRRKQRRTLGDSVPIPTLIKLLALFIVNYGIFLTLSISFLDANTPLDDRILAPVFVSGLLLVMFLAGEAITLAGNNYKTTASLLVGVPLALLAAAHLAHGASWAAASHAQGLGYSSPQWQQSSLLAEVRSLPAETVIYSNAPEVIELLAERPATPLPRQMEAMTQSENADYHEEVAVIKETVEGEEGVIVFFDVLDRPVMTTEELHRHLSLQALAHVEDGAIYGARNRK